MSLTIVLPTAGRPEFTKRFVDHACKLPFLLQVDEDDGRLPVKLYFAKIRDLLAKVTTPYAVLCDNDDLPTRDLQRCVDWLEYSSEYVCSSGLIEGFHMWPDPVVGPHSAVTGQYSPYDTPADYNQQNVNDRVLAGFANSWSYYAVYRTKALQTIWREVCELDLTNLQVHEKFCAMRALTLGKARCLPFFTSLYRQHGTSQGAVWRGSHGFDMAKVAYVMAGLGVDTGELLKRWRDWYAVRDRYFRGSVRKTAKHMFPTLAWYVQNRHRYLPHRSLP